MRDTQVIKIIILTIAILSLVFSIGHYGLQFLPQSRKEFVHDIITVVLFTAYLIINEYDKQSK
jgi:hypothetical protein